LTAGQRDALESLRRLRKKLSVPPANVREYRPEVRELIRLGGKTKRVGEFLILRFAGGPLNLQMEKM